MIKVAITGGSFHGNTGAEAMLITTIARLREKLGDVQFGVYSPYYSDDRLIFSDTNEIKLYNASPLYLAFILFPLSALASLLQRLGVKTERCPLPESVKYLADCDLLLDIAGVSFIDTRKRFLPYNVLSIYPGFLFRAPVIKLAQAIGPIKHQLNACFARHCLEKCTHVFARGDQTYAHLQSFGLSENLFSISPDVAFAHDPADSLTPRAPHQVMTALRAFTNDAGEDPVIGICPSSVLYRRPNGEVYLNMLVSTIKLLSSKGYHFVIFPNATKHHKPKTMRNNDLPLLSQLRELLKPIINCHFIECDLNAADVREILQAVDLAVVSRFHAMIFALLENKLPVVISWSHKYTEVMNQFELGDLVMDHQSIDAAQLAGLITDTLNRKAILSKQLKAHLPTIRKDAKKQIQFSADTVRNRCS